MFGSQKKSKISEVPKSLYCVYGESSLDFMVERALCGLITTLEKRAGQHAATPASAEESTNTFSGLHPDIAQKLACFLRKGLSDFQTEETPKTHAEGLKRLYGGLHEGRAALYLTARQTRRIKALECFFAALWLAGVASAVLLLTPTMAGILCLASSMLLFLFSGVVSSVTNRMVSKNKQHEEGFPQTVFDAFQPYVQAAMLRDDRAPDDAVLGARRESPILYVS